MVARTLVLVLVAVIPANADTFKCPVPVKQPARQALVEPWPLLERVAPMTSWSCLDGETVGVLHDVSGSIAPISWNDQVYELKPQHTGRYLFTSNQNTPMLPYFRAPADAKDTNGFTTPDGAEKWLNYDHVWNLAPGKHAGLTREAHLVRVRVNDGFPTEVDQHVAQRLQAAPHCQARLVRDLSEACLARVTAPLKDQPRSGPPDLRDHEARALHVVRGAQRLRRPSRHSIPR